MTNSETNTTFIKKEEVSRASDLVHLNWRLFRSLPLFLKFLPLTFLSILLASAAPSVFRWYAGNYSSQTDNGFTLERLLWIALLSAFFRISAWALFEAIGMWSSQSIYSKIVRGLTETRTTFFDENPSGRIINRLIRDYDELRSNAIIFVGDFFNAIIEVLGIAAVACFASPWAMAAVIPLLLIFFFIQFQRSTMIEHCRSLSSVASSHVLNRQNDLIEGSEIFILYQKGELLLSRMKDSLRTYLQASTLTFQVDIWASFWIRFFAECFSFIVLIFTVRALDTDQIDTPIAGVIISALFGITGVIGWLDYASSLVSRSSPHLRRVFEFIDLPAESIGELARPVSQVYKKYSGDISFKEYSMSYRKDLPLILKDLNLTIRQGSKTALVGRTGSGKSSIVQSLLRMVYVHKGDILIGGQSIFESDIQKLRLHFGVVPQAPYLFEGTIASNLDRGGRLQNTQLAKAMEAVGLNYSLEHKIAEAGQNLSLGERQLICLARVIACDRAIVLMDEPTSGLDPETDARINWILHTALENKTVITISHRHESIKNYDSILELAGGQVVQ